MNLGKRTWVLCTAEKAIDFHSGELRPWRQCPIVFEGDQGPHVPMWSSIEEATTAARTLRAQAKAHGRVVVAELLPQRVVEAAAPTVTDLKP